MGPPGARCSSLLHLASIETPGAIVTAGDDPFVDARAYDSATLASCLTLHVEASGGHVAYLERRGAGFGRWLDGALVHYVEVLATESGAQPERSG